VSELPTVDAIAAALLLLASLRGLWIGAVREAFSLAGLAAAAWVVSAFRTPAGAWLAEHGPFEMTELAARVIAALVLGAGTLLAVSVVSRLAHRGMREAGLGLADRVAGGLLGAFEGAVIAAALVFGLTLLLGRDDDALAGTRSLAAFEWVEEKLGFVAPDEQRPRAGLSPPPARPSARARG
jgi:uncharacterized membrane protein required for colicin V production